MKKPLPGEQTSYSARKLDTVKCRNKLMVHKQNKELPAETKKFAPRNSKQSSMPVSDSGESFRGAKGSESSSDQDEYKPPKNKPTKIKNLKSTEQQLPVKNQNNVPKVKKLRKKTSPKRASLKEMQTCSPQLLVRTSWAHKHKGALCLTEKASVKVKNQK